MTHNDIAIQHFNSANKLYKSGLYIEALDLYEKAVVEDLSFYEAHFCVAKTYLRLKKYTEGIAYFKQYKKLVPVSDIELYIIGLSKILVEEKQSNKALSFINSFDLNNEQKATIPYLEIQLNNGLLNKYYSVLLNNEKTKQSEDLNKKILLSSNVGEQIKTQLEKEKLINSFASNKNNLKIISSFRFENKEWENLNNQLKELFNHLLTAENQFVAKNLALTNHIKLMQDWLFKFIKTKEKIERPTFVKNAIAVLQKTLYTQQKIDFLQNKLQEHQKQQLNKILKRLLLFIVSATILAILGYAGTYWYEKSSAYNNAVAQDELHLYTNYIIKYGDNEEIHKLRENWLYKTCLKEKTGGSIDDLYRYYPNSKYFRKISFESYSDFYISSIKPNVSDDYNIQTKFRENEYLIPYGMPLSVEFESNGKATRQKRFTVAKDMTVKVEFIDEKFLMLNEEFNDNSNYWNVDKKTESFLFGGDKIVKEIKISNGQLCLENNMRNKLDLTTISTNLSQQDDYEIIMDYSFKSYSDDVFLLFGEKGESFLFLAYTESKYNIGHNENNKWFMYNSQWRFHNNGARNGTLKIIKKSNNVEYYVNGSFVETRKINKYYGTNIGVGVSYNSKVCINSFRIYKYNEYDKNIYNKNAIYYCNTTELNIRENGNGSNKIAQIKMGEPVKYLGEHSIDKTKAYFQNKAIEDYFYKVELLDGTIGWVHGGGLNAIDIKNNPLLKLSDFKLDLLNPIVESELEEKEVFKDTVVEIIPQDSFTLDTPTTHNTDTLIEYPTAEDTIQEENTQATTAIEEIQEEPKTTRTTCRQCKGKGTYKTNCPNTNCEYGFISTTCSTCGGNYRSGTSLCTNAGCNYQGCEYCDYDGAACAQCTRGKVTIEHAQCNGTSKINKRCNACKGKGYIIK